MTATTTRDPAAGDGYVPKTVTVLLPPLTVRSAADGEAYVMVLPAAFLMGLVRNTVAPPVMKTGMPAIRAQAPAQRLFVMVTVFPIPTKLSRAPGGLDMRARGWLESGAPMSDQGWIGKSVKRVEDYRLLTGRGTYIDDQPPVANLRHAAIVRSPHAHARILGYDLSAALVMDGVVGAITGADVLKHSKPFSVGVTAPVQYFCAATDKARFVGPTDSRASKSMLRR